MRNVDTPLFRHLNNVDTPLFRHLNNVDTPLFRHLNNVVTILKRRRVLTELRFCSLKKSISLSLNTSKEHIIKTILSNVYTTSSNLLHCYMAALVTLTVTSNFYFKTIYLSKTSLIYTVLMNTLNYFSVLYNHQQDFTINWMVNICCRLNIL